MPEQLAATRTHVTPREVIEAMREAWGEVLGEEPSVNALAVLAAQWALETGRGGSMFAYNMAGLKSVEGDGRDFTFYTTWEEVPAPLADSFVHASTAEKPCSIIGPGAHGLVKVRFAPSHPVCRFRAYRSLEAGVQDYLRLLKGRFARSWPAVRAGDPKMFATLLRMQGYYTAPVEVYAASMVALFKEMQPVALAVNGEAVTQPEVIVPADDQPVFAMPDLDDPSLDEDDGPPEAA